jgi:hypothetical protein
MQTFPKKRTVAAGRSGGRPAESGLPTSLRARQRRAAPRAAVWRHRAAVLDPAADACAAQISA